MFCILEAARGRFKEALVGIKVVYGTNKHFRSVSCEKWSRCGYYIAVKPFLTAAFLEIAVARDFRVFWVLEAARGKFKETLERIKVVYGTYKHVRSVSSEKWSYYGYFIAVKPFQTAIFLDIAVSRDFCVLCILPLGANSKRQ